MDHALIFSPGGSVRIDGSQRWAVLVVAFLLALGGEAAMAQEQKTTIDTLVRFDQLDFDAFSKQDWTLFNQIHCSDVKVVLPDGHETRGIKQHQSDMAALFVGTPDLRVSAHPVSFMASEWVSTTPDARTSAARLKSGRWTATTIVMEGTFTKPWPVGGKVIPPTGNKLKLTAVTLARWENGCIAEEQLFWDNAAYMQQLGLK